MDKSVFLQKDIIDIKDSIISKKFSIQELISISNKFYKLTENQLHAWSYYNGNNIKNYSNEYFKNSLLGIPFGIKDIFNTDDMPTEMGSPIWKNFTPGNNARVVDKLKWCGAVPIGKTITAEFAVHHLNSTINPHNRLKTPGTSSSGSAVSVAAGVVPFALGTQTAGSIIRPASYCGVWGMKPSFGMIPRTGVLKTTDSLDTVGFLTSRGKNLKIILDNIRVKGPNYPMVFKNIDNLKINKKNWKIGFVKTHTWKDAKDYVKNSILGFIDNLSNLDNFTVSEIKWPKSFESAHKTHNTIYTKSLGYYFKNEGKYIENISKTMLSIIEDSNKINSDDFKSGLIDQENFSKDLNSLIRPYDMIISIGTSSSAPNREDTELPDPSLLWTLGHVPSISVPLFRCPENLPFSIQFVSHKWGDYKLISIINELIDNGFIKNESLDIMDQM